MTAVITLTANQGGLAVVGIYSFGALMGFITGRTWR